MPDSQKQKKTLYLIDGHAHFFRAYHAIRPGTMSSPVTREPTNLTYGFASMMIKLLRDYRPDYLAVVIDVSGDRESFRSEIYPEYKANRPPAPEDLHLQVERCLEMLAKLGVPVMGQESVEADDVIATIARKMQREHPDVIVRIVSKDKDLAQLISDHVELFDIYSDESITPDAVFKSEGVMPEQVVDILALMGDSVDNVPGVPGVGPKTAAQLIQQYGSIENLYSHLNEIKGKRRENLEAARESVQLSRELVRLRTDCTVDFDLKDAEWNSSEIDVPAMQALFRELGFGRHQDDIAKLAAHDGEAGAADSGIFPAVQTHEPQQVSGRTRSFEDSLFARFEEKPEIPYDPGAYTGILTAHDLDRLVARVRAAGQFAFDTETDGLFARQANLCGISVATRPMEAVYIPVRAPRAEEHLDLDFVIARLKPLFQDPSITKTGHNIKFDIIVLRRYGIVVRGLSFDTMIASYVVDATRSSHSLDALSLAFLKHTCTPLTDLIGTGRKQRRFDEVSLDRAVPYAAEDADVTLRLRSALEPHLTEMGLRTLFDEVEMPLVEVLAELEYNGIRVDPDELDRQRVVLQKRIESLRRQIIDASPHPFNPDSPRQLAAALFNKPDQDPPGLGLRPLKRTRKTGPSTDVEVLERLAADPDIESAVPGLIVEYRRLSKLVGTYLVALKDAINPQTGRVHASFNQTVAATGRLSSSDPNLQNIPIRTEIGREIRRAFVAEPGSLLITADYSQIELRLLAHLSRDEALIEAFHQDADIHRTVAAEVFGVRPEEVTSEQRNSAKMINFGIVYGITPFGLARRLGDGTSKEDAATIIADYKARFRRITEFLEACVSKALQDGYVETILKRRRLIPQVRSRNPQQRALGERMAINTVVQGSAADLIKLAMIDLHRNLPGRFPSARMLLQIHDELVFEVPHSDAEGARDFVVQRMEGALTLRVPLKVESAVADTWIDAK